MKAICCLFFIMFLSKTIAQNEVPVYGQCLSDLGLDLCVNVSSIDCYELTGVVTYNSKQIMTRKLSIPSLMDEVKNDTSKLYCQDFDIPSDVYTIKCSVCSKVKEIKLDGDDLHMCNTLSLNCTTLLGQIKRDIPVPCVDIKDCKLFGCQNNCSGSGKCNNLGICECDSSHYGPDCSLHIENNCAYSSYWPKSCWKATFPDCHHVEYTLDSTTAPVQIPSSTIEQLEKLPLLDCQYMGNSTTCKMCIDAEEIKVNGNELQGCPVVRIVCRTIEVNRYSVPCLTLATDNKLVCGFLPQNNTQNPPTSDDGSFTQTIIFAMLGIGGVIVIGALVVYFVMKHFRNKDTNGAKFERLEEPSQDLQPLQVDTESEESI